MKTLWMVMALLLVSTAYSNQETNSFLEFNSENGYVSVPDSNELDFGINDFSISFWINSNNINAYECIMSKTSIPNVKKDMDKRQWKDKAFIFFGGNGFSITGNSDNSLMLIFGNSFLLTGMVSVSTDSLIPNEWNHVCFTVSRDNYLIAYLNGRLSGYSELFYFDGTLSNSSDLFFGKRHKAVYTDGKPSKSNNGFNGYLDDIRFFKRNISRSAVYNLYNEGYGTKYTGSTYEGGEASAVFELDEGHGNKIYDSENGLVGRLHNKVKWIND